MNLEIKIFVCLCLFFVKVDSNKVFSSAKLKTFLKTEKSVIKDLEKPMWSHLNKKMIYRRYLEDRRQEHKMALRNVSRFISNPINCYRLIKRLTVDLEFTGKIFRHYLYEFHWNKSVTYPTRKDLLDAAEIIVHLMHIYPLSHEALADGIWRTSLSNDGEEFIEKFAPMSASDCIELGKAMYQINHHIYGLHWVHAGGKRIKRNSLLDKRYESEEEDPVHLLGVANHALDETSRRYEKWYKSVESKYPEVNKIDLYPLLYMHDKDADNAAEKIKKNTIENQLGFDGHEIAHYSLLCNGMRNDSRIKNKKRNFTKLSCFYLSKANPSLEYVRIKVERLHYRPEVLLFHDVITDFEMKSLITYAKPRLIGAFNEVDVYDFQTTALSWNTSSLVKRLSKRVSRLAGLAVDHTTIIDVIQYNIGDSFQLHYDTWNESRVAKEGHLLATFMFYISDVEQGGATVFPGLGLSFFPVKGSALMWTNLLASGRQHMDTYHAGCPVARGNKWGKSHIYKARLKLVECFQFLPVDPKDTKYQHLYLPFINIRLT